MSFGRPYIMRTSGCIHDGWLVLKDRSDLFDQDYLYYFLGSKDTYKQFDRLASGSTVRNLNIDLVKRVKVTLPPIAEQKRIVAILDEAFEGIDGAIANTEKNLANARELFESYLNAIFIQKGNEWEWACLSDITTDVTDGDHQPPPKSKTGIPFITISNIDKQHRTIDFSDTFKVSQEYFENLKENRKPRRDDVLYTVTGSYAIPVIVDHDMRFCFQRHIGLIRPTAETNPKCLYYMLLSRYLLQQAHECATGTAQKTVSLRALRQFSVPKIPRKEQDFIVKDLEVFDEQIKRLEAIYQQKLAALNELKQSILQKAFTGELTAEVGDPIIEAAKESVAA
jgi:type I restriction enzyme S subunit